MDIAEIRSALKEVVARVDGLQVDSLRDNPLPPCAIIYPEVPFDLDPTFESGEDDIQFPQFLILVLVPYVDTDDAQDRLDEYLSTKGDKSIIRVLAEDNTLGGVVGDCFVTRVASYGVISMFDGGSRFLSGELAVRVFA